MAAGRPYPAVVYLHTLGCPKNEVDSRTLGRALTAAGVVLTGDPEQATHILVNTCGFIREAKEESIAAILGAHASYPAKQVIVIGCLVERYREELAKEIPEVAAWFGLVDAEAQDGLLHFLRRTPAVGARHGATLAPRGVTEPGFPCGSSYAYLKISEGCDELCTFCAIPGIKGPYRSAPVEEIVREAGACVAEGAKELVLVGQDTAVWSSADLDLAGLIDLLAADDRVRWIRVMYLQPEHLDESFLEYMAGQPKLCRYLDLPFQHSHPEILRRMGRWGDGETYLAILDEARRLMPDVTVRSTFIVGFPGETDEHFEHLMEFVERAGFDYAGGFVYSPEEGTVAERLRPRVRSSVSRNRLNRLNELLVRCAESRHRQLIGLPSTVIVDSLGVSDPEEGTTATARTAGQAPEVDGVTYIEGKLPTGTAVGDILTVTIRAAVGYDLVATTDAS